MGNEERATRGEDPRRPLVERPRERGFDHALELNGHVQGADQPGGVWQGGLGGQREVAVTVDPAAADGVALGEVTHEACIEMDVALGSNGFGEEIANLN